jgi:serine protease Do
MQQITPDMAKAVGIGADQGVIVDSVEANSPAARAQLRQGDVITGLNGVAIKTPRDLAVAVANLPAGRTATMAVWRDGRTHDLSVTMGTQPAENVAATDEDTPQDGE